GHANVLGLMETACVATGSNPMMVSRSVSEPASGQDGDELPPMHPSPTVGTEYHGPVVVTALEFGGRPMRLVRPTEPDRLLDESTVHDWNRRDDYMPYWAYLWPAAYLLAEAVACEDWPENLEVLEIGCGLGLAGLTGLACGLRVQFSDYDP